MIEKLESEARLTEALDRAVRAENSLIELRRPRRSLFTAANRTVLIGRLQPFAGTPFDVGVSCWNFAVRVRALAQDQPHGGTGSEVRRGKRIGDGNVRAPLPHP